ncbi:MAG: glucose-6-phosphate isomerase [Chthoniobacter sp.]|uniref:glucose-6-phosphate isomerase n=1 Tax=Chthoniobacter sp. TaxID=2510640 RepID=UPI0032A7AA38
MSSLWDRYQKYLLRNDTLGFSLDISRMRFGDDFLARMEPLAQKAFVSMKALEAGAIANPDENRMVGHYWLRAPQLAPTAELKAEIENCNSSIRDFVAKVYASGRFTDVLVVGIGGSALGPQFVSDALGTDDDRLRLHFFDNTDPNGIDRTLTSLQHRIEHTLVVVISKSGGTPETRNGMLEAEAAFAKAGVNFARNAVAVTGVGSALDKIAEKAGWLARFPMWDWVGGRTSIMSAVGLVPLWLQGLDMQSLLDGAGAMDAWTRGTETLKNPAMLLALMWHFAGNGRGEKDMVVLPYKDRLALYSKYLQQLVMESLGKAHDLDGKEVHQGIAVYGNKGSTDQHAYVQQLRDGVANFFATFIEVRKDRAGESIEVEPGFNSGDFLQGFLRGTRAALYEGGRDSLTISIPEVTPFQVGALIALYDRAVGFYASLVNINAYHQPGVEAGKKAAAGVLKTLAGVRGSLSATPQSASQIATALGEDAEAVFHALNHLAANDSRVRKQTGEAIGADTFQLA